MPEKTIVDKNLEKMLSREEGGMLYLLTSESIGGNAGRSENHACGAANFAYSIDTGEIIRFSKRPRELEGAGLRRGIFHVEFNSYFAPFKIIQTYVNRDASEIAKNVLEDSSNMYNVEMAKRLAAQIQELSPAQIEALSSAGILLNE